jgi:hypothetical protein
VQPNIAVDRAVLDDEERLRRDLAPQRLTAAEPPAPQPRERLRSGPGMGPSCSRVWLSDSHASHRGPRGQEVASYGRGVKGAHASAGKRDGTSGHNRGGRGGHFEPNS